MSLASLERELVGWLRIYCKNPKLRAKDLFDWSSNESAVRKNAKPDETVLFVPQMGLWAAVMTSAVKQPIPGERK